MSEQETMAFFYEIFDASLPRLGPGEDAATKRALDTLRLHGLGARSPESPLRILDLGCGNGAQTLQVAKRVDCAILAIDNHRPYLDELLARADEQKVAAKIQTELADMARLSLPPGSFDLIWSEGALYNVGFLDGLAAFRSLLVPAGLFAVSELCWFDDAAPSECREFFAAEYPDMRSVASLLDAIRERRYDVLDHFALPESAWWIYYGPLEKRLEVLRGKIGADPERLAILDSCRAEIEIYRRYSQHYGYEFFQLRRAD